MFDQIALCIRKIAEITRGQIEKDRPMPEITECPKCKTSLQHASGIGDFCPNTECDVFDGPMQAAGLVPEYRAEIDTQRRMIEKMRSTLESPKIRAALRHESEREKDRPMPEITECDVVDRIMQAATVAGAVCIVNRPTLKFKMLPGCPGLPEYKTAGAAGMDLRAYLTDDGEVRATGGGASVTLACYGIAPGERAEIRTGLMVAVPEGYELQIRPRSGLARDHGIMVVNSPGTIDSDYRGEIIVLLLNTGKEPVMIWHKDRIAQAVLAPVSRAHIVAVDELDETARGEKGFGSTGV